MARAVLARESVTVDEWLSWVRAADIHGAVHLARITDPLGSTLCGYHRRHWDEAPGPWAMPGRPWPGGQLCPDCAALADDSRRVGDTVT